MPSRPRKPANARNGRNVGKPRDREPAALALAGGATVVDAAAKAGVSERAIRYWLEEPEFVARVRELRSAMYSAAVGRLAELSGKAATTLGELLESASEAIRLRAATAVLELGPRLRELDLGQEIEDLRRLIEGQADGAGNAEAGVGPAEDRGAVAGAEPPPDAGPPAG